MAFSHRDLGACSKEVYNNPKLSGGLVPQKRAVSVVLPVPLDRTFTYYAPADVSVGSVVHVSFGRRTLWGVVWREDKQVPDMPIKDILSCHPHLFFHESFRYFLESASRYNIASLGLILKMTLPSSLRYHEISTYQMHETASLYPVHQDEMNTLKGWQKSLSLSSQNLRQWLKKGWLVPNMQKMTLKAVQDTTTPLNLTSSQLQAAKQREPNSGPILLEGLTGSGKSEVLLFWAQQVWNQGKQVLILLPEIVLTPQWVKRVATYFQLECALWHSNLSEIQRQRTFEDLALGRLHLIIGARSALFLPYANLGLIIVDEEHEPSYKQAEGVLYHGRDMALLRAARENIPVILSSATPSLEARYHVNQGTFQHIRLKERYGAASLATFHCIDMRPHPPKKDQWISVQLRKKLETTYENGEQSLLFLNRRGFSGLLICVRCQYRAVCSNCSVWLAVHGVKVQKLICHYCGYKAPLPEECPSCHGHDHMIMMGPGIERIAEEVRSFLPQARVALLSSDHSAQDNQKWLEDILDEKVDVMVGTQIVAKGHHFPKLTCIGIVDTDFALADINFRAYEHLFQLLYQVTGRAGRGDLSGQAYLQTMFPQHGLFQHLLAYNWDGFVLDELARRAKENLPPFTRLTGITLSDRCQWRVENAAWDMQRKIPVSDAIEVMGPAPAFLNPLRSRYRWKFLIRSVRSVTINEYIGSWLNATALPSSVRIDIERDPYNFL